MLEDGELLRARTPAGSGGAPVAHYTGASRTVGAVHHNRRPSAWLRHAMGRTRWTQLAQVTTAEMETFVHSGAR